MTGKKWHLKCGAVGVLQVPQTARKRNKWALNQMQPELSLKAKMILLNSCLSVPLED